MEASQEALLIRLAMYPAPNPLSMLTTLTQLAHELSIASNAATPPKDAPYPTLVGTAITGQSAMPPTTLASAPSMPATATMALEDMMSSECDRRRWMPETPAS